MYVDKSSDTKRYQLGTSKIPGSYFQPQTLFWSRYQFRPQLINNEGCCTEDTERLTKQKDATENRKQLKSSYHIL